MDFVEETEVEELLEVVLVTAAEEEAPREEGTWALGVRNLLPGAEINYLNKIETIFF